VTRASVELAGRSGGARDPQPLQSAGWYGNTETAFTCVGSVPLAETGSHIHQRPTIMAARVIAAKTNMATTFSSCLIGTLLSVYARREAEFAHGTGTSSVSTVQHGKRTGPNIKA